MIGSGPLTVSNLCVVVSAGVSACESRFSSKKSRVIVYAISVSNYPL